MKRIEISETQVQMMIVKALDIMTTDAVEDVFNGLYEDGKLLTGRKKITYLRGQIFEL